MCTIALAWRVLEDTPVAVAANRDESLDRESLPPRRLASDPETVAPQDDEAGGTWIGVTERGLFVAITNRWTAEGPPDLPAERSRGLLVRDALGANDADAAVELVREAVREEAYAGFNLLVADADRAAYLEWDGELRSTDLDPGVHVIVNPGLNDVDDRAVRLREELRDAAVRSGGPAPHDGIAPSADAGAGDGPVADRGTADPVSAPEWLDAAARRLRDHEYEVCIHRDGFGTRSSSLLWIDDEGRTAYRFADGPPCETEYEPVSVDADFLTTPE